MRIFTFALFLFLRRYYHILTAHRVDHAYWSLRLLGTLWIGIFWRTLWLIITFTVRRKLIFNKHLCFFDFLQLAQIVEDIFLMFFTDSFLFRIPFSFWIESVEIHFIKLLIQLLHVQELWFFLNFVHIYKVIISIVIDILLISFVSMSPSSIWIGSEIELLSELFFKLKLYSCVFSFLWRTKTVQFLFCVLRLIAILRSLSFWISLLIWESVQILKDFVLDIKADDIFCLRDILRVSS